MHSRNYFVGKYDILKEDYQKFSKNLASFMFLKAISFCGTYEKSKEPRTSYNSIFRLPNMFISSLSEVMHHLAIFNAIIPKGF